MNKHLYFVEVGILLTPNDNDNDFEYYNLIDFYTDIYGFYDENKLTFLTQEEANEYAEEYVNNGVEHTYAICYDFICNIDDDELIDIINNACCEYSLNAPTKETITQFIYKEKGEIKNECERP